MTTPDIPCGKKSCRFHSLKAKRGNCITKYRFGFCDDYEPDLTELAVRIQDCHGNVPDNGRRHGLDS